MTCPYPPEPKRAVFVLGAPRSGTSALASMLDAAGIDFGAAMRDPLPGAPRGFFEHPAVNALDHALLGAQSDPAEPVVPEAAHSIAHRILRLFKGDRIGVKDPNMVHCLGFWLPHLAGVQLAGTIRAPGAAVASLRARASRRGIDLPQETAFAIWQLSNQRLLELWRLGPFPLVDFSAPPDEYQAAASRLLLAFGIEDDSAIGRAYGAEHIHEVPGEETPASAEGLYRELQEVAAHPVPAAPVMGPGWSAAYPAVRSGHVANGPIQRTHQFFKATQLDLAFAITERDELRAALRTPQPHE
jgi:hypothetical protein